jgi:hypothetical protein
MFPMRRVFQKLLRPEIPLRLDIGTEPAAPQINVKNLGFDPTDPDLDLRAMRELAQTDVRTGGSDSNAGGFDTGVSGFATDGAVTSATGASPVFSSASYTFVAGDVGAWVYIGAGTNWNPGFYQIASVSGGNATLSAAIGAACLASGGNTTGLNTVAGCATTASPTSATWGLDYSQQNSAQIAFTDMVIDATTNTKFTSAAHPVGKNFVGNIINVTSGTGFTVQRVAIVSTSGTVATCDKALGTLSSTGGNGNLGGALLTIQTASTNALASNTIHIKAGTYTQTFSITFPVSTITWIGYNSIQVMAGQSYLSRRRPTARLC